MNCIHARRLFGAYWDDEITQAEREWLEAHFGSCARCRTEYEDYARALEALATLPRLEPAPDLAERVLARARRAAPAMDRFPGRPTNWIPVTAAAVATLLIAGTLAGPWLASNLHGPRALRVAAAPPVREPVLVASRAVSAVRSGAPSVRSARVGTEAGLASVPDSLFDHSEDVEFILDPVTLRRGRPAVTHPTPAVQGQQATITF